MRKGLPRCLYFITLLLLALNAAAQQPAFDSPGAGNPLLPGYFADPTVKKFGDTWYIYATTDGNGGGFGPSQVWKSKDFVNWSLSDMNWPITKHYWAPDVTKAADGKYYMYYCKPVEIFGASSTSPVGPWTPLFADGRPVVTNYMVPDVITLDGQTFKDDDGRMYLFWGTWGIYPNSGCGVGLLNPDMKTFAKTAKIPNTVARDFFEAPFMFKRKGIYYLTYSAERCEDASYKVRYVMSKTGPFGPYVEGKNNPILSTSADGTVHGPGHQSVLQEGDKFYLIYHRHNNPHNNGGYHRQVAADMLQFDAEGNIEKLVPTHKGVGFLAKNTNPQPDLAFGKTIESSSNYSDAYKVEFAVDNNNGTLWKPANNRADAWLKIDLGSVTDIKSIHTQFEYATWYYQYKIESSTDGVTWSLFADRTANTTHGSPMVDHAAARARYIRLTIVNTEYPGLNKAVWNIKVFGKHAAVADAVTRNGKPVELHKPQGLLVNLDAAKLDIGNTVSQWKNEGVLGGKFLAERGTSPVVAMVAGKKAVVFTGETSMASTFKAPPSLAGNSSWTVAMWVYNPTIETEEPVIGWTQRGGTDITNASFGYGNHSRSGAVSHWGWPDMSFKQLPEKGKWHHITFTFDGTTERIYVDGRQDNHDLKMLFLDNLREFYLGTDAEQGTYFTGAIAGLKVYDVPFNPAEVEKDMNSAPQQDIMAYADAANLDYGAVTQFINEGVSGGQFAPTDDPGMVSDVAGRIALLFTGKNSLQLQGAKLPGKAYTILMSLNFAGKKYGAILPQLQGKKWAGVLKNNKQLFDGKWHQLAYTCNNNTTGLFIDGKPAGNWQDINTVEDIVIAPADGKGKRFCGALSSLIVFNRAFGSEAIAAAYKTFSASFPVSVPQAVFIKQPAAISSTAIMMAADTVKLPGGRLQYYFSDGKQNSGWRNNPFYIAFGKQADTSYQYSLNVKDNFGNITRPAIAPQVSTADNLFEMKPDTTIPDGKITPANLPAGFDGLVGSAASVEAGQSGIRMESLDSYWDGNEQIGPFLFTKVSGDFIAEVEVTDMTGQTARRPSGANECGIMVAAENDNRNLVQNGIMPGWGIGNIITNLSRRNREQTNNQSAWNFYRYLQIQRLGNLFYLRGSSDGTGWNNITGSPIKKDDLGTTVRVGLYHATYGKNSGWGTFKNFKVIRRK